MKTCCNCKQEKENEEFVKDNRRKDGYSTLCKECKRTRDKIRYHKIKDDPEFKIKERERLKKYKELNKDKIKLQWTEYNNRPEVIEKKSEWYRNKQQKFYNSIKGYLSDMYFRAKKRAIEKNIPFDIELSDLNKVDICPILNIELDWNRNPRTDNTPSLDKIIPEKGYIKGNIRIISNLANMMKSSANFEQLLTFSKNIEKYIKNEEIVRTIEKEESIELEDKELLG